MTLWEDNNDDVSISTIRNRGNSHLRASVRGGTRGAVTNRAGSKGTGAVTVSHRAVIKSPIAMAIEVLGRLLGGIIAICALVLVLAYLLPLSNEGERDYREPQRAESFGWEVAR